ncbi:XRE family transcriptional regulator [Candidatus Collierbacteria bacterium CG10_big_fil_rev_8_21_14_0_10_44_9]|uniref:XRE family transcriptional regulator n=1 Tax=Candidatus Collierbacteria bacterium CG10_big_fil_rev_8_21_14_0_10_44_9 TaxID=1974535 RepID=A0A2H0VKT7_9BACT|nr:MAG: XRE family transcriptional regulator [Candidatus Collierbacteria bacterium CG10_big_fil_rev_8_21_14_0_10_44_9]
MLNTYLQKLRKSKGYSQSVVAIALGITRPTYVAFEQGKRDLTTSEAKLAADFLGVSLTDLITEKNIDYVLSITPSKAPKPTPAGEAIRISIPSAKLKKFNQVLLYILNKVGGKPNVGKTVLYKLLYFIDFDYYEKYEEQLMGLTYIKNYHGPTPNIFGKTIEKLVEEGKVEAVKSKFYKYNQTKYLINPDLKLDLSLLSAEELSHIDHELARLSDQTAVELSNLSHQDVPWLTADESAPLDYEAVFYRTPITSVRVYDHGAT